MDSILFISLVVAAAIGIATSIWTIKAEAGARAKAARDNEEREKLIKEIRAKEDLRRKQSSLRKSAVPPMPNPPPQRYENAFGIPLPSRPKPPKPLIRADRLAPSEPFPPLDLHLLAAMSTPAREEEPIHRSSERECDSSTSSDWSRSSSDSYSSSSCSSSDSSSSSSSSDSGSSYSSSD